MYTKTKISPQLYWLVHPLALAFYVFLILLYFVPDYFQKYEAEVISSEITGNGSIRAYNDLDQNGTEEAIFMGYNGGQVASFYVQNSLGKIIGQWNFNGEWLTHNEVIIGNYNQNQNNEIYCLHIVEDSLYLSIINPLGIPSELLKERYISKVGLFNEDRVHVDYVDSKFLDINNDGYQEFVFILYAGYSRFPRKVFIYDIHNDQLSMSPESAAGIRDKAYFLDINNDGFEELIGGVSANENIHYPMPYTDSSCWIMVHQLKQEPDFLFPPIEFPRGLGSTVKSVPFIDNGKSYIATRYMSQNLKTEDDSYELMLHDQFGKLLVKRRIQNKDYRGLFFINPDNEESQGIFLSDFSCNIYKADSLLNMELFYQLDEFSRYENRFSHEILDLTGDGEKEVIIIAESTDIGLLIYSSKLKDPVYLKTPNLNTTYNWRFGIRQPTENNPSNLLISTSHRTIQVKYARNPYFLLRYPVYLLVYIFIFLIFWFLQKVQRSIIAARYETEKQLMQQQMALSKKQMEPHFLLNTVNNIGYLFMKEDKKKAMFYLGKFAALMRRGLMNADKIATSLEEELEFVEDYLILQNQLMDDELDYSIKVDKNIEEDKIQIPHSLIYTFAENAIKHGLRPKEKDRELQIQVSKEQERVKIVIQDNGVGRQKSEDLQTTDTGKGMEIIKTIIKGYNQLHGGNISYTVEDVLEEGIVVGTLVEVWV